MIEATYNILVRVHEDVETIVLCHSQHGDGVLYPLLVVLSGALVLDGLPGEDISDGVVSPAAQAGEMTAGILDGKGTVDKGNGIALEEVVDDV